MNLLRELVDNHGRRALRKRRGDGVERSVPPEESVARARALCRWAGITRVADVTGLDRVGIAVVMVVRPLSRSLSVSQGKGCTPAAAEASGLWESLELHHAETIEAPLRFVSYADLSERLPVADPDLLPRPSTSMFHPHRRILWIEAVDLTSGRPVWVPDELVDADYTLPRLTGAPCFSSDSNGLASGNHHLEALVHGLCELIERDATTLWKLRSSAEQASRKLRLDAISEPVCRHVLQRLHDADLEVNAWDLGTDIGVPVVGCELIDRSERRWRQVPALGFGCRPEPGGAFLRALLEAAQSRLTFIAGSRDDIHPREYAALLREAEDPRVVAADGQRALAALGGWEAETFEEDFERILEALASAGIHCVAAVDLTKPGIGLPVVRVVLPGLEGHCGVGTTLSCPGPRARALLAREP